MSDTPDPFELEPQREPEPAPEPKAQPKPQEAEAPPPPPPRPPRREPTWTEDGELEVDERTVSERAGRAIPRGTDVLEDPAGWPAEALQFPFRPPGPTFMAVGFSALFLFDLVGMAGGPLFLSWIAKFVVVAYLLRGQFHVIGTSAAGRDEARGWEKALHFDRDDLVQFAWTLLAFALALAPGALLYVFERMVPGILLLVLGSMYASVVALGAALQDRRLKWPWHALAWLARRPVLCLVGALGWWTLWMGEVAVNALGDQGVILAGFVALVMRAAGMYALLVSARAIGVMGRTWTGA